MATDRTGSSSIFWGIMKSLADGDLVTMELLYNQTLHRLQDNGAYLLARFAQVYTDLASTAAGTQANLTGSVNVLTFNYDSGAALIGKTIILDEDTTTAQTVTFGVVTTPAQLLAAFSGLTNITTSIDSLGRLVFKSGTVGAGSNIFADPAATAYAALLDTPSSQSGSGTANDGASRIGVAAIGSLISAGTLRAALTSLESAVSTATTDITGKVSKAGDTMTGGLAVNGNITANANATVFGGLSVEGLSTFTGQRLDGRITIPSASTAYTIDPADARTFFVDGPSVAGVTYTLKAGVPAGSEVDIICANMALAANVAIVRESSTAMISFSGAGGLPTATVRARYEVGKWVLVSYMVDSAVIPTITDYY